MRSARELPALALFADGRAAWLVALGGPIACCDPDRTYANAAHRRLLGFGAPPDVAIRLDEGLSTRGELRALRRLASERGWRNMVLSTDRWHTRRVALEAARVFAGSGIGWTVVAPPGDADTSLGEWWQDSTMRRRVLGEWAKLGLVAFTPWAA